MPTSGGAHATPAAVVRRVRPLLGGLTQTLGVIDPRVHTGGSERSRFWKAAWQSCHCFVSRDPVAAEQAGRAAEELHPCRDEVADTQQTKKI
jgi:hypothetical protein